MATLSVLTRLAPGDGAGFPHGAALVARLSHRHFIPATTTIMFSNANTPAHRLRPLAALDRGLLGTGLVAALLLVAPTTVLAAQQETKPQTPARESANQTAPRAPAANPGREKVAPAAQDGRVSRTQRATNPTSATAPAVNVGAAPGTEAGQAAQTAVDFMRFEPAELDFGEMAAEVAETMTVKVVNTSDEPILISRIVPSCGCTTTNFTRDPIPPGGFGEAEFTLKPPARQGVDLVKRATFMFDGKPPVVLTLKGTVVEYVRIAPDFIDAPAADETKDGVIELTSVDGQPFRVVSANPPIVDDIEGEPATAHTVRINWDKWIEAGRSPKLSIVTDHPKATTLGVTIKRSIRDIRQPTPPVNRPERVDRAQATTPLIQAVKAGDATTAKLLIESGADVNAPDVVGGGRTALHWAVKDLRKDLIPVLLDAKANIEAPERQGKTPLAIACEGKDLEVVTMLVERGANVNVRDQIGGSPLLWASGLGTPEMVKYLISKGAEVNVVDVNGMTPLLWASGIGGSETVAVLLSAGADVEVADRITGDTALMRAARTGRPETVKLLLGAKSKVNARNQVGMTPFMLAAASGSVEKLKLLKDAGADIAAKDVKGWNALDHARNRVDTERAAVVEFVAAIVPESGAATSAASPAAPATRPVGQSGQQ